MIGVLACSAAVASQNFARFFNHDSFFYVARAPSSWAQVVALLAGPDTAQQYRPLTLLLAALLKPLFDADPIGYHVVAVLFHLANVVLCAVVLVGLSRDRAVSLVGTFLFGCQGVVFFAAYDMGYVSDFLSTFFCLLSLIFFLKFLESKMTTAILASLFLFACALWTKEVTVTFAVALLVIAWWKIGDESGASRLAVTAALPHLALAFVFGLLILSMILTANLYAQKEYAFGVSGDSIAQKVFYLRWALNLPPMVQGGMTAAAHWIATLLWIALVIAFVAIGWPAPHIRRQILCGLTVSLLLLLPALLLRNRVEAWYWYFPSVGFCWALAALAANAFGRLWKFWEARWLIVGLPVAVYLMSTALIVRHEIKASNPVYMSRVMQETLLDFQRQFPKLPEPPVFYVLPTAEKRVSDYFEGGELLRLTYGRPDLQIRFADYGAPPPDDSRVRVLHFFNGYLDDFSDFYWRGRAGERKASWFDHFPRAEVSLSANEYYPDRGRLETPGNRPAFLAASGRLMVTIAGAVVRFPEVELPAEAVLNVSAKLYAASDGVVGELLWESGGSQTTIWKREFVTSRESQTEDVPLGQLPRRGRLVVRCYNLPGKNSVADWLGWRNLVASDR